MGDDTPQSHLESSRILRKQSVHYHTHNNTPLDFILNQVTHSTDNHNKMFHAFLMSPVYKG